MNESWKADLEEWLAPFVSALGHKVRERLCPLYVAGLIGPGDRKSIQPMAAREGAGGYDQLHHFVAAGTWDQAPLEDVLLQEADRMVGGQSAFAHGADEGPVRMFHQVPAISDLCRGEGPWPQQGALPLGPGPADAALTDTELPHPLSRTESDAINR